MNLIISFIDNKKYNKGTLFHNIAWRICIIIYIRGTSRGKVSTIVVNIFLIFVFCFFFVRKGTGLCVISGKGAFAGCISGIICCDNSSQFVTEVSIIGEVRGKLGRNFDIGIFYIFVLVYIYIYTL